MTIEQTIKKAIEGGIPINSKGKKYQAIKDDENVKEMAHRKWYLTQKGYAVTVINGKRIKMHHFVMGKPPQGMVTDHINRNPLDNRKSNLRFVSRVRNSQNNGGVGVRKHGNLWEANICLKWKKMYKSFKTKAEASAWRNKLREEFIKTL